jgi:hypothetical protein
VDRRIREAIIPLGVNQDSIQFAKDGGGGVHVAPSELSIKEWDFLQRKIPYEVIEKIFIDSHVERATLQRGAN